MDAQTKFSPNNATGLIRTISKVQAEEVARGILSDAIATIASLLVP